MCTLIACLAGTLLIASTLGDNTQQWMPYPASFHGFNQQHSFGQPSHQWDQQIQASEFSKGYDFGGHGDTSSAGHESGGGHDFGGHDFGGGHNFGGHDFGGGHNYGGNDLKAHSYPVHQHIEEENPEPIKHYKEVVVPITKNVHFKVYQPVLVPVPHPIPIQVPVPKAVVIPIIKEISIPVEKSVPYPVEKTVHVPKIKEVPFEVVKHIIVPVEKPIPFKVPVYETIIHTKKGSHKI